MTRHKGFARLVLVVALGSSVALSAIPAGASHEKVTGTVRASWIIQTCDFHPGCGPTKLVDCDQPDQYTDNNPLGNVRRISSYTSVARWAELKLVSSSSPTEEHSLVLDFLNNACDHVASAPERTVPLEVGETKMLSIPKGIAWLVVTTWGVTANDQWSLTFCHVPATNC